MKYANTFTVILDSLAVNTCVSKVVLVDAVELVVEDNLTKTLVKINIELGAKIVREMN